ncbi:MAG TPA: 4-hydroxybutyrate CoA-transferase, partial [Ferruginibacter sp.]|nr:4-hydroxybutyrate CoA-transferase [Ferruginibacter sp.]
MKFQYQSPESVASHVQSNQRVFIQGSAATPVRLAEALLAQKDRLHQVELVSITLQGIEFCETDMGDHFFINSLFVSQGVRKIVNGPCGDYVPVFLSEIPALFRRKILPLDVALVQVSPPDANGYCSLGTSVDIARAAVDEASIILAQVNPNVPRTHGDSFIHFSRFTAACYTEDPLPEVSYSEKENEITKQIGLRVAELVEDGATLQLGIGSIPDAVLKNLTGHKNLGLHTEMFSDGVIPLIESGVINNKLKKKVNG